MMSGVTEVLTYVGTAVGVAGLSFAAVEWRVREIEGKLRRLENRISSLERDAEVQPVLWEITTLCLNSVLAATEFLGGLTHRLLIEDKTPIDCRKAMSMQAATIQEVRWRGHIVRMVSGNERERCDACANVRGGLDLTNLPAVIEAQNALRAAAKTHPEDKNIGATLEYIESNVNSRILECDSVKTQTRRPAVSAGARDRAALTAASRGQSRGRTEQDRSDDEETAAVGGATPARLRRRLKP